MGLCLCRGNSGEYTEIKNEPKFINIFDVSANELIIEDIRNYNWRSMSASYYPNIQKDTIRAAEDAFKNPIYKLDPPRYLRGLKQRKYRTVSDNIIIEIFSKHIK